MKCFIFRLNNEREEFLPDDYLSLFSVRSEELFTLVEESSQTGTHTRSFSLHFLKTSGIKTLFVA